ncbi:MAG TPA: AI-2E family transporter [Amnibacterium sp.]|nr:AI-2E family transporter [Amnibacterium sp.]
MPKRTDDPPRDPDEVVSRAIPVGVRIAGAWSWRIVGVLVLLGVVVYLVILLHIVVVPVLVATLLSGLLTPLKNRLTRAGSPKWLAVLVTFLGTLLVIAGLVVLVVLTLRTGIGGLEQRTVAGYKNLIAAIKASPLGITDADVANAIGSITSTIQKNSGTILAGALSGASVLSDILVGLVLSLFVTLFFLIDGDGIWRWCIRLAPRRARAAVDGAGRAAWLSVGEYARVQILVALIDAVGIGLVALLLGLGISLVVPIAVLVFLSAFIPFVGAIVTGGLAVLVALVYLGPVQALLMLAGVVGVNQLESHVLQPLLMGGAVRLHPIAVVLTVATGSLLGGIAGAVFAVPFVAAMNSAVLYLAGGAWKDEAPPPTSPVPEEPRDRRRRRRRDPRPEPQDVTTVG